MRLSIRISFVMLIISVFTITLLTVLMHFKYHVIRLNLISDRLNVVSAGISYPISNALLLGIDIQDIKELQETMNKAKEFDSTISDIVIFKIVKDGVIPVFTTSKTELVEEEKVRLLKSLRIAKNKNWKGSVKKDIKFVGVTLKDVANQERAGIVIYYDLNKSNADEAIEIRRLYQRLFIGIFIIAILNFISGLQNTRDLSTIMKQMENVIVSVSQNPENKVDLGKISDPGIRSQMRLMINSVMEFSHYITKADRIIKQIGSNPREKGEGK